MDDDPLSVQKLREVNMIAYFLKKKFKNII